MPYSNTGTRVDVPIGEWFQLYTQLDQELVAKRASWRHAELEIMRTRDRCLRQLVGDHHGGATECAKRLGVTAMQISRMLGKGTVRSMQRVLDRAGVDDAELVICRGGRKIGVMSAGTMVDNKIIEASKDSDLVFAGTELAGDACATRNLLHAATRAALVEAEIPKNLVAVTKSGTEVAVHVAATDAAGGLGPETISRCAEVLRHAGLNTITMGTGLRVEPSGGSSRPTTMLTFKWADLGVYQYWTWPDQGKDSTVNIQALLATSVSDRTKDDGQ